MFRVSLLFILMTLRLPIWAQTVKNPFLYQVSTPAGTSYILGTIHASVHLKDFQFDLSALVKATDIFMPEMDTAEDKLELWQKDGPGALRLYAAEIPVSKKRVDAWAAQKLTEFGFANEIAVKLVDGDCTQLGLPFEFGHGLPLDAQLMHASHLSHRQIIDLDSNNLRDKALGSMNCDFHQIFTETDPKDLFIHMSDYIKADADFYRAGVEPTADEDAATLLRNKAWIPKLEKQMSSAKVLVAVGYGHLFGPHGVLQLLRNDGYRISRVSPH